MNWDNQVHVKTIHQTKLFENLTEEEKEIVTLIQENPLIPINAFTGKTTVRPSSLPGILLALEIKGVVRVLPGNRYQVSLL